MASVSQNASLIRSFWPIIKSFSPLILVRERAAAKISAQSVTRAQVANLVHAEIIPRLMAQACPEMSAQQSPAAVHIAASSTASHDNKQLPFSTADLQEAADFALADDETGLLMRVHELLDSGISIGVIAEEYIGQTARYLGECWVEDTRDFTEVTLACGRLQSLLRYLADIEPMPSDMAANAQHVLLVTAPHEQHTMGLTIVSDAFRREGWEVTQAHEDELLTPLQLVNEQWFDVVGISIGADRQLPWLKAFVTQLRKQSRNPDIKVLAGGAVLNDNPAKATVCGADACATSASSAPIIAKQLLIHATIGVNVK